MASLDWERVNRERRLTYSPSPRVRPATQKQLDYILGLAHQKGQPKPRLPKTMAGAGSMIDRLLELPDRNVPAFIKNGEPIKPRDPSRQETLIELQERFPAMTPMTVNSMYQLFEQVDPIGMLFFFDSLIQDDDAPAPLEALIPYVLERFVEAFC